MQVIRRLTLTRLKMIKSSSLLQFLGVTRFTKNTSTTGTETQKSKSNVRLSIIIGYCTRLSNLKFSKFRCNFKCNNVRLLHTVLHKISLKRSRFQNSKLVLKRRDVFPPAEYVVKSFQINALCHSVSFAV